MRRRIESTVIGLDLSLRGSAACAIPIGWDQTLRRVRVFHAGRPLAADASDRDRVGRLHSLSTALVEWCEGAVGPAPCRAFLEDYAFSQSGSHARSIAELTGLVKWRLAHQHGFDEVRSVSASRARKVLLGRLPKKDAKRIVVEAVRSLDGAEGWTEDECDAFVVANAGVMLAGGVALTFAA